MARPRRVQGFSLFETLVATLIAALMLGALLQVFASIWRGSGRSEETVMATLAARSVLARLRPVLLADGLRLDGVENRWPWQASASRVPLPDPDAAAAAKSPPPLAGGNSARAVSGLQLYKVSVDVQLPSGRHVVLESFVAAGRQ